MKTILLKTALKTTLNMAPALAFGSLCVFVAACAPVAPEPTLKNVLAAQPRWPSVTLADLERGRILYLDRCTSCHAPYAPGQYGADRWPSIVGEMVENAKLSPGDEEAIVRYLVSATNTTTPPTTPVRPTTLPLGPQLTVTQQGNGDAK